jgi:hypothetical protein
MAIRIFPGIENDPAELPEPERYELSEPPRYNFEL